MGWPAWDAGSPAWDIMCPRSLEHVLITWYVHTVNAPPKGCPAPAPGAALPLPLPQGLPCPCPRGCPAPVPGLPCHSCWCISGYAFKLLRHRDPALLPGPFSKSLYFYFTLPPPPDYPNSLSLIPPSLYRYILIFTVSISSFVSALQHSLERWPPPGQSHKAVARSLATGEWWTVRGGMRQTHEENEGGYRIMKRVREVSRVMEGDGKVGWPRRSQWPGGPS